MDLYNQSVKIILNNQKKNGSYIASPNFPTYAYSWFRDGSYIAYAMDRSKNHKSSYDFHIWGAKVIINQSSRINSLISKKFSGEMILVKEYLPARYSLDGFPADDNWTDFQLDGYGTWLWAISEHIQLSGNDNILDEISPSIELITKYLTTFWDTPCYDFWEEHLEAIHPATLAAIYAGLSAVKNLSFLTNRNEILETIDKIKTFLETKAIHPDGYYRKMVLHNGEFDKNGLTDLVDASLIGLAVPYNIHEVDQENISKTLQKIEEDIYFPNGGVYRYLEDTFYGGGEWVLLSPWIGWYWCKTNQYEKAIQVKRFIQSTANDKGELPEQISDHLLAPTFYSSWVKRWGKVADPLLWSQAMYIILCEELKPYEKSN